MTIFSPDEPNQIVAVAMARTSKEDLSSKPKSSAVVQSADVQKERAATKEASHQQMSMASAAERVTPPANLTDTQGRHVTHPDIVQILASHSKYV